MGNCLTCFKEPTSTAQDNTVQYCHKGEMPEAHLFPAPSHHVPASTAPADSLILSNGNHLMPLAGANPQDTSTAISPLGSAIQSSITATTPQHHHQHTASAGGGIQSRFLHPSSRKIHSKSAPAMGLSESKLVASETKLHQLFDLYKDEHEDAILDKGIEQFCKDLQILPDDFKILVLAWQLRAEQMCRFSRSEFVNGLKVMRADSIRGIQTRLPEIVNEVERNDEQFKDLYRFTFKFGLDSTIGQRILSMDMAKILWRLVFTIREPPILGRWLNFLERHGNIRGIPRDTWFMFLNFAEHVGNDLSSYDDSEAWPSLFDDFVEYENDQANQNVSSEKDKECDGLFIKQD